MKITNSFYERREINVGRLAKQQLVVGCVDKK